jgi:hypothetical protein
MAVRHQPVQFVGIVIDNFHFHTKDVAADSSGLIVPTTSKHGYLMLEHGRGGCRNPMKMPFGACGGCHDRDEYKMTRDL